VRRALVLFALLAACKSPSVPSTFGVNITVETNTLSSSSRSEISQVSLLVSGDETYNKTFDVKSAVGSGEIRFRYIPGIQDGRLTLGLDALASDGTLRGRAAPVMVTVTAGHAVAATLVLGDAIAEDMGTPLGDGGTCEPGSHACNMSCVDDRSLDSCGTSCSSCPVTAHATAATCDGTSCGVSCESGYHICGGACVSATDANSCNMSCTPCTAPSGGSASCDGTSCGGSCPAGQKLCFGACIATGMACNGSCPTGTHECNGNCFDDTSVNSCGTSCTPCPVPANATAATCNGGTCGFTCNSGYKQCGTTCIPSTACCTSADCTQPMNGVATCDTSTNVCVIACNGGYTKCGTQCISTSACCMSDECPQPTNGVGICNATHMCTATCNNPANTVCSNACVDTTSDNNNCGGCGVQCAGQCTLSRCVVVLASSQFNPAQLAVDASNVYWIDGGDVLGTNGSVMKVATTGGTATPLASSQPSPYYLVIDNASVYWTTNGVFGNGGISRIAKSGGSVSTLASSQYSPNGLAVDGTNVYFTNVGFMTTMGNLNQVPVGGGTIVPLATAKSCSAVAVNGSLVYWPDGNGALLKTPVGGGTSVQIATGSAGSVATDGTNLYWADVGTGNNGDIMRMPIGGASGTPIASGLNSPHALITDGVSVYWVTGDPKVYKVPVGGGMPTLITADTASFVAVDATSVYWTKYGASSGSTGSIVKATPK
jgi:hypothetical protein